MNPRFTDVFLKNLKLTTEGQVDYVDSIQPHPAVGGHLGVRVGKRTKTFFIRYQINGKKCRHTIGKYPAVSLAKARSIAAEKLGDVYKGIDPQGERDARNAAPTFDDLWIQYQVLQDRNHKQLPPARQKIAENSKYRDTGRYNRRFKKPLGNLKVVDVRRKNIATLLESIAKTAPIEANRCHSLLRQLFKRALNLGWIEHSPMYQMDKPSSERPRSRYLTRDEIKPVWNCLDKLHYNPRDAFKVMFLTAQRSGEVMAMKWSDLDFDKKEWLIDQNKSDRPHVVPLSDSVISILENRPSTSSDYVFKSISRNKQFTTLSLSSYRLHEISGVSGWTPHDIRRTARTLLAEIGVAEHVSELILNHSLKGIVAVYNRHQYLSEKRDALNRLAKELEVITNG